MKQKRAPPLNQHQHKIQQLSAAIFQRPRQRRRFCNCIDCDNFQHDSCVVDKTVENAVYDKTRMEIYKLGDFGVTLE